MRRSGARQRRVIGAFAAVAVPLLVAPLLTSCSSNATWVQADDSAAWPGTYGNSRNASFADRQPAPNLVAAWDRPLDGASLSQPAITNRGIVAVTADTETGCNTFTLELTVGRKSYCRREDGAPALRAPTVDQFENSYVGSPGWMFSVNPDNQIRWRYPMAGTPLWVKLTGNDGVLAVSHVGQVLLLNAHSGKAEAPAFGLFPDISPPDNGAGLQDCPTSGPGCPISGPPAVDTAAKRAFIVVSNAFGTSKVLALDYGSRDGRPVLRQGWERTDIAGGVIGSPALSADGSTLYVNLRSKQLAALDARTGATKWTYDLGYETSLPPSVSPDGIIIPAAPGENRAPLRALRDEGGSARVQFTKADVAVVSPAAQIRGLGYAVVRPSAGGKSQLLEFAADTGATQRTFDLPAQVQSSSGVSIGPDGELVVVGDRGQVFAFTSGRRTGDSVETG